MVVRLQKSSRRSRLWLPGDETGIPRNGLVALYDPYMDTFGRNCFTATGIFPSAAAVVRPVTGANYLETSHTTNHYVYVSLPLSLGASVQFAFKITPIGRTKCRVAAWCTSPARGYIDVDFVAKTATVESGLYAVSGQLIDNGDGSFVVRGSMTLNATATPIWGVEFLDDAGNLSYAGDTAKGFAIENIQLNLGSTLFPYSPPAGEPGTLQTSLDYSGNGNHLTLGADTNASTDDPAFTGTAWSFDGGDFIWTSATVPIAGKASRTLISVVSHPNTTDCLAWSFGTAGANTHYGVGSHSGKWSLTDGAAWYDSAVDSNTGASFHVIAVTHDIATDKSVLYVNGVAVKEQALASLNTGSGSASKIVFGAYLQRASLFLTGLESINAVYTRTFSPSEVAKNYVYLKSLMARRGVTLA